MSGERENDVKMSRNPLPYESNLRDRLWMWGHDAGISSGLHGLPPGGNIPPAEALDYMGIPNICMIRWQSKPEPPFDGYLKQFARTKRLAWSIIDGAREPYAEKKRMALELADAQPNLVGVYLDDFFSVQGQDVHVNPKEAPAHLTVEGIRNLKAELEARKRHLDLSLVLYSNQLRPSVAGHIRYADVVAFWTWNAADLGNLERNFERYKTIVPDKRTLLGLYMWDFGGERPIPLELMQHQCRLALRWFEEGRIEGLIFHCTPLCDMKLEAVEWARRWIAEHGDCAFRTAPVRHG